MITDYSKMPIQGLYVSSEMAERLYKDNVIPMFDEGNMNYVKYDYMLFSQYKYKPHTAFLWDMVNNTLTTLPNTLTTPEDDLAEQCIIMPDNGVRLMYLNNL